MNTAIQQRRKALSSVKSGIIDTPIRVLIYGAEKVGKSTFASGAPKPIFVGSDSGTERLDVDRLQPTSWDEAIGFIHDIAADQHSDESVVIDPLGWFEPMCWARVAPDGDILAYGGGYNKGYDAALSHWRQMIAGLERCWSRGMHVICVAHAHVKSFQNPEGAAYDRYEVLLHHKASGLFRQWVDVVGFACLEVVAKKERGEGKAKGKFTGHRALHLAPSAAYDAGSRLSLPEELPLGWGPLWSAVSSGPERLADLMSTISSQVGELKDDKVKIAVDDFIQKHRNNPNKLSELSNRLAVKIQETAT